MNEITDPTSARFPDLIDQKAGWVDKGSIIAKKRVTGGARLSPRKRVKGG